MDARVSGPLPDRRRLLITGTAGISLSAFLP
jgi:hypothetical protein